MDFFADEVQVASLKNKLDGEPDARSELFVELAWHLRQRDTHLALSIAERTEATTALDHTQQIRLSLIRAEASMLFGQFDLARSHLNTGNALCEQYGDDIGKGDAEILAACLAHGRGDSEDFLTHTNQALAYYTKRQDGPRSRMASAWIRLAQVHAFDDTDGANFLQDFGETEEPAVTVLLGLASATYCFQRSDNVHAAAELFRLIEPAEQIGMIHIRLHIGVSLCAALSNLGDHEAALTSLERTVNLARERAWPLITSDALALMGNLACEAGQTDRAIHLLEEAESWVKLAPDARDRATLLSYISRAKLAAGQYESALTHAREAQISSPPNICIDATLVAARALLKQDCIDAACDEAKRALGLSQAHHLPIQQVEALRTLAEIQAHAANAPNDQSPLAYLEQAHAIVEKLGTHSDVVPLLNELSLAYEAVGNFEGALAVEREARNKASRAERRRVDNLLALLSTRHRAERQRANAEHQRDLAIAEAARARELESSLAILENLNRIGREITANLDISNVLHALIAHLGKLVQVDYVGLSVLESNGRLMIRRAIENGKPLMERRVSVEDPNSLAARCARERRELLSVIEPGKRPPTHTPGTNVMLSAWFGPLMVGDELVGVLSIQSQADNCYGEREQLILRTLSAYVAVAVANARVYTRLGEQHARLTLVEAEMRRLAATDALTSLPNRRYFLTALDNETKRTRRTGRPLSVIMGDIDHFKAVNDTLGHAAGDVVLVRIAKVLDTNKRTVDIVGRLGGEEFALLLPETDVHQAAEVADRLRSLIAAERVPWEGKTIPITMSFGCAMLDMTSSAGTAAQIEDLLKAADRALYRAKDAGRNRTAWSQGEETGIIDPLPYSD